MFILQYHGCWWLGNARRQGITDADHRWWWWSAAMALIWLTRNISVSAIEGLNHPTYIYIATVILNSAKSKTVFLAATKQLYKWYFPSVCPSVRLSVCLSHLFHHVPIIVSSWNFQELLPWSKVISMQKVKVRGQRSRSQRSRPNLTVSGL